MSLTILFFSIYIAVVVIIGLIYSRKETEEDFMIADRKVAGIQVAATMSAGFFDGAVLSIYLAYIYQYGISAAWLFVGLALGFLLLRGQYAKIIKRKSDEMKAYTMAEYFYKIFGKKNGLMFSFILVLQYFLLLIVNLVIAGKVLALIFGVPYSLSVIIGGVVILSYLLLAGFKAVIKTDFFQLVIMFVMSLTVAIFLFGKTNIPVSEFNPIGIGLGNIIGFLLLGSIGIMVAPDLWQRIFAARDETNLKRGLGYSAIILPLLAIIISIVGLTTKQFFPHIVPEDALITGFSKLLPIGLKEFGMVLLYAVALSSSDTITFMVSSIITRDLKNYTAKFGDESMKKLTRFFMLLFVAIGVIIGIYYQNIIALGLSLGSLSLSLFPIILGSFYWTLNKKAVFWSLILAILSVVVLFVGNALNPQNTAVVLPVAIVALFILQKFFKKRGLSAKVINS
ncbi:MAG: sodium:solute symporter family protein [Candidatus Moranbacteria bacterium]|nr:sodium:solute symporter family protein [Candidatus Moranbacteria bacterium]